MVRGRGEEGREEFVCARGGGDGGVGWGGGRGAWAGGGGRGRLWKREVAAGPPAWGRREAGRRAAGAVSVHGERLYLLHARCRRTRERSPADCSPTVSGNPMAGTPNRGATTVATVISPPRRARGCGVCGGFFASGDHTARHWRSRSAKELRARSEFRRGRRQDGGGVFEGEVGR